MCCEKTERLKQWLDDRGDIEELRIDGRLACLPMRAIKKIRLSYCVKWCWPIFPSPNSPPTSDHSKMCSCMLPRETFNRS